MVFGKLDFQIQIFEARSLTTCTNINSKWMKNIDVRCWYKTTKPRQRNKGILLDIVVGNDSFNKPQTLKT